MGSFNFNRRFLADNQLIDQPRRMLNTSKAYKEFGFKSKTQFKEGLKNTIEWYASTRPSK